MPLSSRNRFVLSQALWMMQSFFSLVFAMGGGLKWMVMSVRVLLFGLLIFPAYSYHIVWYVVSPTVIRRVAYRASRTTKLHNLRMLLREKDTIEELLESTARRSPLHHRNSLTSHHSTQQHVELPSTSSSVRASPTRVSSKTRQPSFQVDNIEELSTLVSTQVNEADGSLMNAPIVPSPLQSPQKASHGHFIGGGSCSAFEESVQGIGRSQCFSPMNDTADCVEELLGHRAAGECSASDGAKQQPGTPTESASDDGSEEDPEDAVNLHNRAYLDVFLPLPLDSLMKTFHATGSSRGGGPGGNAAGGVDGIASSARRKRFPVVVIVGGGAWIIGCNLWSALLAKFFAAAGYLAFTPDYRNFPQATMEDMVLDVSDSIAWVIKNCERYNGDVDDITIIGQSAGAHLTMMSILSQARVFSLRHARQQAAADGSTSNTSPEKRNGGPTAATGIEVDLMVHLDELDAVGKASKALYNRPRYNPRDSIRRYIGLSGIYNVRGLASHLHRRGLYKHVMYRLTGGRQHAAQYSIPYYFDDERCGETGDPLPHDVLNFFPRDVEFLHGDEDHSAPVTESTHLAEVMRSFQRHRRTVPETAPSALKSDMVNIRCVIIPGASHTDPIVEEPLCGRGACVIQHVNSRRARQHAAHEDWAENGVLQLTASPAKRPFLLKVARLVCPF